MFSPIEEVQVRLAAIVESSDDAIVSKDLNGIVKSWNAAAERIFGYTAEEMIGQPITKIVPPERDGEEPAILDRLKRGERIDHFQTIRVRKDGQRIDVSVTISPIRDSTGKVVGASKIARDNTTLQQLLRERESFSREREELLESERAARSNVERISRMKDEFLSTLSHELRTPLNAILGWTQLIKRNPSDETALAEGLGVIERNARIQTQLIEDLLDMSRIISGKVRLDVQRIDLVPVIQAAIESVKPSADAKEICIRRVIDPRAGHISGDPGRLQQVVWNLLTNAIKFTPRGGKVDVVLQRINSHVELIVSDTGIGIKPEFLPHVFERFRQADASITREHTGLGLGLSIVKHLVELHGGRVAAKSPGLNQGSTFCVELPLAIIKHNASGNHPTFESFAGSPESDAISLGTLTILVVDDEPDALKLMERLLADRGARVLAASSADQALGILQQHRPDVVVSDIGMPKMDGYELMREIRRLPAEAGGRVPAIALTAFARSEDRTRAMLAGYQMHLAKPIEAQELIATVASVGGRTGV
ncbi:MAG TPA: ATP-binding protein [Phycisphaerae bacterium]|jgi:PAS domain S-box-containing protein|nr:ATP-binding protein [Phycisphaerae bacterium]